MLSFDILYLFFLTPSSFPIFELPQYQRIRYLVNLSFRSLVQININSGIILLLFLLRRCNLAEVKVRDWL